MGTTIDRSERYPLNPGPKCRDLPWIAWGWDRTSRWCRIGSVIVERCGQCGFDSDDWSDVSAIAAIQRLPSQWTTAIAGVTPDNLLRRPVDRMWSIGEYTDHVREVLFGMRYLLDTAASQPGTDLGNSPSPQFAPQARQIDVAAALDGIDNEARALSQQLSGLSSIN